MENIQTEVTKTGENYLAWNIKKMSKKEFWSLNSNKERYKYLAMLAHLAANSHNTQPWLFKYNYEKDSLIFYIETSRVLPASDIVGRQAVISIGCAIANFEVAAEALGCEIVKNILLDDAKISNQSLVPIKVAEISIQKTEDSDVYYDENLKMYNSIFTRRVDRGEYDHDRKINSDLIKKIEMLGRDLKVKTILILDWGRKVALAELQAQADSFVVNNKEFANELVNDWMLENDSDLGLGMPGDTFRLNDDQTKRIKFRFRDNLGFESDDAISIAQLGKKGILSCQCVGMLIIEKDEPSEWLKAGIVLEKGALLFESEGVAWAVHAGLAEVSQVNMLMLRPIAMTTKRPVILFRAGYLKGNETRAPHSPRMTFDKVWSE